MNLEKVLTIFGRAFIGAGVLVFLFVAYQLWGTGLTEARHQQKLQAEAAKLGLDVNAPVTGTPSGSTGNGGSTPTTVNTTPAPPPAPQGSAVAVIRIPKIDLQKAVVEGTDVNDLKKAPGHYSGTPLPGQPGNASIAGHRTTYGAPFGSLDKLAVGDEILTTTRQGTFRYKVSESKIVDPEDIGVIKPTNDNRLTLTTCHPKYSAAKRLIIVAILDTSPAPAAAPTTTTVPRGSADSSTTSTSLTVTQPTSDDANLSGTAVDKFPVIMWALATLVVGLLVWAASNTWNRWICYAVGAPIFLVFLFFFFENFSRLLPANA